MRDFKTLQPLSIAIKQATNQISFDITIGEDNMTVIGKEYDSNEIYDWFNLIEIAYQPVVLFLTNEKKQIFTYSPFNTKEGYLSIRDNGKEIGGRIKKAELIKPLKAYINKDKRIKKKAWHERSVLEFLAYHFQTTRTTFCTFLKNFNILEAAEFLSGALIELHCGDEEIGDLFENKKLPTSVSPIYDAEEPKDYETDEQNYWKTRLINKLSAMELPHIDNYIDKGKFPLEIEEDSFGCDDYQNIYFSPLEYEKGKLTCAINIHNNQEVFITFSNNTLNAINFRDWMMKENFGIEDEVYTFNGKTKDGEVMFSAMPVRDRIINVTIKEKIKGKKERKFSADEIYENQMLCAIIGGIGTFFDVDAIKQEKISEEYKNNVSNLVNILADPNLISEMDDMHSVFYEHGIFGNYKRPIDMYNKNDNYYFDFNSPDISDLLGGTLFN